MSHFNVIIVGGGAAGFFAAINIAENNPDLTICILERAKQGLEKVRISGGGRCNVTHAEFTPSELVLNYPRGEKELLGPFHQFMTGDTIEWFEHRGVELKIEDDGRMFPVSNSSQTIIDCFLSEAKNHGIEIRYRHGVTAVDYSQENFRLETSQGFYTCDKLLLAAGSSPKMWSLIKELGHSIIDPVPSLFTFNIDDPRINNIPGVVVNNVAVSILDSNLCSEGPLLITHWGMSAPAILKLSAFGALELAKCNYNFKIIINFLQLDFDECLEELSTLKHNNAKKLVTNTKAFNLPKRLWHNLVSAATIGSEMRWADTKKSQLIQLANQLTNAVFKVDGKSTFKEEFVTAGGVDLKEINFKTFESRLVPNLYFAGEILNIDAVTGGFNFQNAWTSAYIAAKSIAS